MLEASNPSGRNDRHGDRSRDGCGECEVKAQSSAISVHAGEQQFARAAVCYLLGPLHRVPSRRSPSAVGIDLPAGPVWPSLCIDRRDNALAAELGRRSRDQRGILDCGRVDAGLVRACVQESGDILNLADAATYRQRNEYLIGNGLDHWKNQVPLIGGRRDVQECDLVSSLSVITLGHLHRIARVAEIDKVGALDHPPCIHIETGNDAFGQHGTRSLPNRRSRPGAEPPRGRACPHRARGPEWRPSRPRPPGARADEYPRGRQFHPRQSPASRRPGPA